MYKALKHQQWAVIWTIIVLVLCNIRMPQGNGGGFFFEGFDKMVHLGFFFILSVLLFYGECIRPGKQSSSLTLILKIILINAVIGGLIELLQWKVFTYRSAEWWDFGCDMAGSAMAVFNYLLLYKASTNEN